MTTGGSGAVFFLGTRAHYQVLQQPESQFDVENGNTSTETIYQNPSVQTLWAKEQGQKEDPAEYGDRNWNYCDNDVTELEEKDKLDLTMGVKRRTKRRPSETALCEREGEMKPALLNHAGEGETTKSKPSRRRINLLTFLTSLAKRKRRLESVDAPQIQYLHHLSSFTTCTYRESCRCAECQSRYFECDESDEYSSDDSDYSPRYITQVQEPQPESDEDDEVFVDTVPGDNTSTDLLIDNATQVPPQNRQMSVSSSESVQEGMEIEVAAGTPVLLNYLLTHPITCSVQ